MNKYEIAYLIQRDLDSKGREQRYRTEWTSATSEDTEPEGLEVGFLKDPHEKLYPCAWEGEKLRPEAKQAIMNHVLNAIELEFQQPDKFIYFTVYGSGASYNWDEAGDFDVQMWVDIDKFNELHEDDHDLSADDLVASIRRIVGPINFPSFKDLGLTTDDPDGGKGDMLIQFYPKSGTGSESENLSQKPYACYDMETDEWLVRPKPIRPQFYGDTFLMVEPKAQDVAVQAESALDELQRNVTDWQFWYAMWKKYKNHAYKERFEDARDNAEQFKESVKTLFEGVFGGRRDAYSEEGKGIEDERDILQKQLEVWGIFQRLKHWARQPLPWEEQKIPKEAAWRPFNSGWLPRTATWTDVMNDAITIRDNGNVQIQNRMRDPDSGQVHTIAQVASQSDPSKTYETEIWQDDPNSPAITLWSCDCEWGQKSWGRTRQWKKYEGRPCKHTLATYWTALGTPVDDGDVNVPQQPVQPQMGEGPQDWVQAPTTPTPGGPNIIPAQPLDQPQEIQSDLEQQPTPVEQQPPAFSLPQGPAQQDSGTIHFPGALSSWKRSDHNGWTNYETWWVKGMIDNDRRLLMAAEQLIDRGGIAQDLADWAIQTIIGPYNASAIKDAQDWNDIPEDERIDHEWEETNERTRGLLDKFIGPDVGDTTPNIIDPEKVNWWEIGEHIKRDIEEEYLYEHGLSPSWENPPDPDAPGDFTLPESWGKLAAVLFPPCPNCGQVAGFEPYPWARGYMWCKRCQHLITSEDLGNLFNNRLLHHDMDIWTLPEVEHPIKDGGWRKAGSFTNGDIVRNKVNMTGIDRDEQSYTIPRNSSGEVIWSDDESTIVIFPLKKNGPLQSHLVRVEDVTDNFYLSPTYKPF